ncbi:pantoate--beta-alanine ligase [Pseudodesulfovibrio piezophilus]|uniref:Pantothenate synthetase n=1 Tax=Pseudodesulfovibrio piezophilus (strain DSM 21447 / JCM 15486 / C1TLV30) TaxID=1322246 RepID=M1WVP9_PSEP2|nr:pantoate--beta-alanine ligase [Pseudodesulfovibrio piezophilus]CCH48663.1 Pantothenate synthetase [Pseudodesulfovibrio piezophilus C1TLV30]
MKIIKNLNSLQEQCFAWRNQGLKVGLVPTMGFFHDGHQALMRQARGLCDKLVVSLFLNPTQFGENEDLDKYPHDFDGDCSKAEAQGVDVLFAPAPQSMYHENHATWIDVPALGSNLCGASRQGHFRGVCTVVTKLFMLTQPEIAVFGQKDWQQLAIIRRMVRDLNIPVEIIGHEIVREPDGLAMSSRNAYLTKDERDVAPAIRQGLLKVISKVRDGERNAALIKHFLQEEYAATLPTGKVDYIEAVDPADIEPVETISSSTLVAVAIRLGKARLIDNILIEV